MSDELLGALIREVAGSWSMPPRGLHHVSWHERAGGFRRRAGRDWLAGLGARLAAAAMLAVTGAVALALIAVWLRAPAGPSAPIAVVGSSSSPAVTGATSVGGSVTPPIPGVSGSPIGGTPGQTARPTRPVDLARVALPVGDYVSAQLAGLDGKLRSAVANLRDGESVAPLPDGTLLAARLGYRASPTSGPGLASLQFVSLRRFAVDGSESATRELQYVKTFARAVDGTDWPSFGTAVSVSADGQIAFVGWAAQQTASWKFGLWVARTDGAGGVQDVTLPDLPLGPRERRYAEPPLVTVSPDGGRVMIRYRTGTEVGAGDFARYIAPLENGRIGSLSDIATGAGTLADPDCRLPLDEGWATADTYYAACMGAEYRLDRYVFRRVSADGSPLGDTPLGPTAPNDLVGAGFAVDHATGAWYSWNPFGAVVARVSLGTGAIDWTRSLATTGSGGDGWSALASGISRWLAPSAAAKVTLEPSLVLSPDGGRLYALAVDGQPSDAAPRPGGVYVIDPGSGDLLTVWPPTADLSSIATSADGARVYALGTGGVDATGAEASTVQPSVTVFSSADGRVIGKVEYPGSDILRFLGSRLP